MGGVSGATKVVGTKTIKYMSTNAITSHIPKRAISTSKGKWDVAISASGVVNTVNAMNRE